MYRVIALFSLLSVFLAGTSLSAQEISPDLFRQHMTELAKHPRMIKPFSMIDQQNNYHLYLDVICFNEFYSREPIITENYRIFPWKTGDIVFFNIEQFATLVSILEPSDDKIIYEFISQVDKKRYLIQALFVDHEEDGWKLIGLRKTRIKPAKKPIIGNIVL